MRSRARTDAPSDREIDWDSLVAVADRVATARVPASEREDVRQAVLEAVTRRVNDGSWDQITNPHGWVATVAVRRSADVWVRRLRETEAWAKLARLRPACTWSVPSPDSDYINWSDVLCVLSYQQSRCFVLYEAGFSYDEIASALHISMGAVSTHLHRARSNLQPNYDF